MKWRALLLAIASLVGVNRARATTITITLTGTISTGNSGTGMFGNSQDGSLANEPITIVYTFNDAYGSENTYLNQSPSYITSENGETANPGTAVLTVNGIAYPTAIGSGADPSSKAEMGNGGVWGSGACCYSGSYIAQAAHDGANVQATVYPANNVYVTGTWETAVPGVATTGGGTFIINDGTNYSSASYNITSLTVSGGPLPCDIPTGETSILDPGHNWSPSSPSLADWEQTLTPVGDGAPDFSGTNNVREMDMGQTKDASLPYYVGSSTDTCYTSTVANLGDSIFPPSGALTGSTWSVGSGNIWGDDSVGWINPSNNGMPPVYLIPYYRSNATLPCQYTQYQQMQYECPNGTWFNYGPVNTLHGVINDATHVTSDRGSATATETYVP